MVDYLTDPYDTAPGAEFHCSHSFFSNEFDRAVGERLKATLRDACRQRECDNDGLNPEGSALRTINKEGRVMEFLKTLGIEDFNPGACFGNGKWSATQDAGAIESINPATGERIASVYGASIEDYERVMATACSAFEAWRTVPAPKRGEAVRLVTDALRRNKDVLGSLVALEMGKIAAEGMGEGPGEISRQHPEDDLRAIHRPDPRAVHGADVECSPAGLGSDVAADIGSEGAFGTDGEGTRGGGPDS